MFRFKMKAYENISFERVFNIIITRNCISYICKQIINFAYG